MITLNEGQRNASHRLKEFIESPINPDQPAVNSNRYICLTGGGGTGKTTSIFTTLAPYKDAGKKILLLAPTNKAVRVLAATARKFGVAYDCMTLASALGLAVLPSEDEKRAVKVGKPKIPFYDIVVIDEASMNPARALDILEEAVMFTGVKIIFMGDDYQLPPVKEARSEAFDMGPHITLTKVERHAGPILAFAQDIRGLIDKKKKLSAIPAKTEFTNDTGIFCAMGPKFVQEALNHIDLEDTDQCRLLAWTNRRVDEMNSIVRQHFHGKKVPQFLVGDRVVTTDVVKSEEGNILLPIDEECVVKQVVEDVVISPFNTSLIFTTWSLVIEPIHTEGSDVVVHVLQKKYEDDWFDHLKEIAAYARKTGDWSMYWTTRESVHSIKHCYAITVHRSQGSTFGTVFLDVIDIQKQKNLSEQLKLLYVGATRPSHQLFVNRTKFIAV
jgi:exodeoxyribonuclease-5